MQSIFLNTQVSQCSVRQLARHLLHRNQCIILELGVQCDASCCGDLTHLSTQYSADVADAYIRQILTILQCVPPHWTKHMSKHENRGGVEYTRGHGKVFGNGGSLDRRPQFYCRFQLARRHFSCSLGQGPRHNT